MSLPVVLLVLLLLTGGVLLVAVPGRGVVIDPDTRSRLRAEDVARWTGLALGAMLAWWLSRSEPLGSGLMMAPTVIGVGAVLGALGADTLTPRQRGAVRTAGLAPRAVRDYLPGRFTAVVGGFATVLVALLAVTTATGSTDDMGRAGRSFVRVCGPVTEGRGPWPGSYYSLPLFAALGVATALCGLALHRTARRPALDGPGTGASDDERRRAGMAGVVAAWGLLVTGSLTGTGVYVEGAIHDLSCAGTVTQVAFWALLPTVIASAGTAVYCLARLFAAGGRRS